MNSTLDATAKLILRLTLGILILLHGIAKLLHGIGPIEGMLVGMGLPAVLAYGVFLGELLGPILLIIGFHARLGAALIAVNMLFAFLLAHTGQLTSLAPSGGWQLELQGMFLFTAVALALMGPGRFGINQR
ncbi:MAG: DoxX family protein [Thiohalobacteraceae bacterium]|nr:DoxX family protein [Gammaproteobacteria bacterium]